MRAFCHLGMSKIAEKEKARADLMALKQVAADLELRLEPIEKSVKRARERLDKIKAEIETAEKESNG